MSGPNQTPEPPNDRELEDFLAGRGQLREVYHAAAQEKPPQAVDEAILKMAAQTAAEPHVPAVKVRAVRRWPTSVAAAAVLVLSLAVFVQVRRDPVAEQAVFSPMAKDATQSLAAAQPAAPPLPMAQMQRAKVRADVEQTQRKRGELKKEMAEADAVGALTAAAPAPEMAADRAPQAMQEAEVAAFAKSTAETRAMRDKQKPAPPAAAMAAKSMRSAPADRMGASPPVAAAAPMPAMTAVEETSSGSEIDKQIDQWLKTCAADSELAALNRDDRGMFKTTQQWRGLAITGLENGSLLFAQSVSREAIAAQLNQLGPHAAECLVPAQSGKAMSLRCGCPKP